MTALSMELYVDYDCSNEVRDLDNVYKVAASVRGWALQSQTKDSSNERTVEY